jgi:hypothetical protein
MLSRLGALTFLRQLLHTLHHSGMWVPENIPYDVLYLCGAIIVARVMVLYGLMKKNYLAA